PWFDNPLKGATRTAKGMSFNQRHEANPLELFFDLVFVANLATFTAYHSISNASELFAYIGFFSVIWSSWFQITLHDVRFARDSIYERVCKMAQFVMFVGFALVGSSFHPYDQSLDVDSVCITLLMLRVLLIIQYFVVLVGVHKQGYHRLYLPLFLNILIYSLTAAMFAVSATAFTGEPSPLMYSVGYIILFLEALGVITISCMWRTLSFKSTHLVERMGLLTLIVIGEGAIGVTKTIGKLMGKGQDLQLSGLIFFIVLILFLMWMLYFDNRPRGSFGTIRQQIWSVLHFPLHLGIVGVVEGSQQMALAHYVLMKSEKFNSHLFSYCMDLHLNGSALVSVLETEVKAFKFDKKVESDRFLPTIHTHIYATGNATGLCSSASMPTYMNMYKAGRYPQPLTEVYSCVLSALYSSVSVVKPEDTEAVEIAYSAWRVVYNYYWSSVALAFICLAALQILMQRGRRNDGHHIMGVSARGLVVIFPLAFIIAAAKNHAWMYTFIGSSMVLPTMVILLLAVVVVDRL
ncbi:bacterial low temperature requirement A protein-domain-containing protein, partial [Clohesyomyces aquaticus]